VTINSASQTDVTPSFEWFDGCAGVRRVRVHARVGRRKAWIDHPRCDQQLLDTPQLTAPPPRQHRTGWTLATWSGEVFRCSLEPRRCFWYAAD
jgi:hypothetical protein